MSLELPANFNNDIQGRDTNLVPIVSAGGIVISTNSIVVGGVDCKPLLLNIPSLKESIDIEKRNYKISSVNLDISNLPYEGVRFSELVVELVMGSFINQPCGIWWASPSANSFNPYTDDRMFKIFDGIIRKYTHDDEKVRLVVEDRSQATLHKDLPL